jgi:hypothetical protein
MAIDGTLVDFTVEGSSGDVNQMRLNYLTLTNDEFWNTYFPSPSGVLSASVAWCDVIPEGRQARGEWLSSVQDASRLYSTDGIHVPMWLLTTTLNKSRSGATSHRCRWKMQPSDWHTVIRQLILTNLALNTTTWSASPDVRRQLALDTIQQHAQKSVLPCVNTLLLLRGRMIREVGFSRVVGHLLPSLLEVIPLRHVVTETDGSAAHKHRLVRKETEAYAVLSNMVQEHATPRNRMSALLARKIRNDD